MLYIGLQFFAHKKGMGSTKNGRDSESKRLGPIALRLTYELLMMAVLAVKNIISINNKLRNQNEGEVKADIFAAPDMSEFKESIQQKKEQVEQAVQARRENKAQDDAPADEEK